MEKTIRRVLDREIKMTTGCTDPGAVAYASAKAASILDGELKNIDILLSKNIYKNAVYVGIPGIKKYGIEYAALLGAMVKKPELKLAVLGEVTENMLEHLESYAESIKVSVSFFDTDELLYISVTCKSDSACSTVVIAGDYDRICHVEKNNLVMYHSEPEKSSEEENLFKNWNFRDLFLAAVNDSSNYYQFLEYEEINKKAGMSALTEDIRNYMQDLAKCKNISMCDMANMARIYVLNASKVRMSGEKVSIVSLAGSGNLGITALLSVGAVCDALRKTHEEKGKALYLSALMAVYIKNQMNRLTVMCGTALAGAAGAAAATVYLLGGGCREAEMAVNTVIGSIGGVLCDGAKESCAFKVGFAAECGVMSGFMAVNDTGIRPGSGIITYDIDKNIRNIGYINNAGMKEADKIMLEILRAQKKT